MSMIARKHGGWQVIIGEESAERYIKHPSSLRVTTEETARLAKAKPHEQRTNAERVALSRERRRGQRERKRPFTSANF